LLVFFPGDSSAESMKISNPTTVAAFGPSGLIYLRDTKSGTQVTLTHDDWSLVIDNNTLRGGDVQPKIKKTGPGEITYDYELYGYRVQVLYRLGANWKFVSKQLRVLRAPGPEFTVRRVVPWNLVLQDTMASAYVPSTYVPQFGATIEQSRKSLPGKDFGEFLRLADNHGVMLTVQNPYLEALHDGQSASVGYAPEMQWQHAWGEFASDIACIGTYSLSGQRLAREMVPEWRPARAKAPDDGMDRSEIAAFTDCVRESLISPAPEPISVEVGWTLNDYQIDVGTPEGEAEYKRIIDTAAELGIRNLLYAPGNSMLARREDSADSWGWEYVLWLNLGQKIRKGEWDPTSDPIPRGVTEMVSYARRKHVGLLAYVYPSVPFEKNSTWLVKGQGEDRHTYATLASRDFQDYLIRNLIAFQKRTGISGYSFDYAFLNLQGSGSYSQWYGLRRVMETLRRAVPSIVIDGRQTYFAYGPWSWLAGSYPHPTGNDEQPESFKPFPDLHFDRVSADRTRFVNYWYRNYQFAPTEVVPGYATHQTERSINLPPGSETNGRRRDSETVYTRYRPRDWDYLGYRYSFLSSIGTGGWNNLVNMIPARDSEEWKHFSAKDKAWIRKWLGWTAAHKKYLLNTRTILDQPALGHVDGTSAISGDHGYLFLFNPNYKQLPADFVLDETLGLSQGGNFLLREIYPNHGRIIGKREAGVWNRGDMVHLRLDGTSATVMELIPAQKSAAPALLHSVISGLAGATEGSAILTGNKLAVTHLAGEYGTSEEIGVLLPASTKVANMTVNGHAVTLAQTGRYLSAHVHFGGTHFGQAEELALAPGQNGALAGTFTLPQRVREQLAARKKAWPIPWAPEDYDTTWLASERLLLFVQFAEGDDAIPISASLDDQPLTLKAAYSSVRVHPPSFVGFYADLSTIAPDQQHRLVLTLPEGSQAKLEGVFFDNVEPQSTAEIVP
jgi:hypothetical protein